MEKVKIYVEPYDSASFIIKSCSANLIIPTESVLDVLRKYIEINVKEFYPVEYNEDGTLDVFDSLKNEYFACTEKEYQSIIEDLSNPLNDEEQKTVDSIVRSIDISICAENGIKQYQPIIVLSTYVEENKDEENKDEEDDKYLPEYADPSLEKWFKNIPPNLQDSVNKFIKNYDLDVDDVSFDGDTLFINSHRYVKPDLDKIDIDLAHDKAVSQEDYQSLGNQLLTIDNLLNATTNKKVSNTIWKKIENYMINADNLDFPYRHGLIKVLKHYLTKFPELNNLVKAISR